MPQTATESALQMILQMKNEIDLIKEGMPDTKKASSPGGLLFKDTSFKPAQLLAACSKGVFPDIQSSCFHSWLTPPRRCVLVPEQFHLPKKEAGELAALPFCITMDQAFSQVVYACLNNLQAYAYERQEAWKRLYEAGLAHSVEVWFHTVLVGGLYGASIGRAFFCEAMFQTMPEASGACLKALAELLEKRGICLLDCRENKELVLPKGGLLLSREDFEGRLQDALRYDARSADALTMEYRNTPETVEKLWPCLPWDTHYTHAENGWTAAPSGAEEVHEPELNYLDNEIYNILQKNLNDIPDIYFNFSKKRKYIGLRVPDSSTLEVRLTYKVDLQEVCDYVKECIHWIEDRLMLHYSEESIKMYEDFDNEMEAIEQFNIEKNIKEGISEVLAENFPDTELNVKTVFSKRRKRMYIKVADASTIEVRLPYYDTDKSSVCSFVEKHIPWLKKILWQEKEREQNFVHTPDLGAPKANESIEEAVARIIAENLPETNLHVKTVYNKIRKRICIYVTDSSHVEVRLPYGADKGKVCSYVKKNIPWLKKTIWQEKEREQNFVHALGLEAPAEDESIEEAVARIITENFPDAGLHVKAVYSKRRKRESLHVTDISHVEVRLPYGADKIGVCLFVKQCIPWLEKRLNLEDRRAQELDGDPDSGKLSAEELSSLAQKTLDMLNEYLPEYEARLHVSHSKVTVRAQRSKWGSCSHLRRTHSYNLHFNLLLALTPEYVQRYIVVHELCHIKVMNHSAAFWELVQSILPDYWKAEAWIKKEGWKCFRRLPS